VAGCAEGEGQRQTTVGAAVTGRTAVRGWRGGRGGERRAQRTILRDVAQTVQLGWAPSCTGNRRALCTLGSMHGHCIPETIWAGLEDAPRLIEDASAVTILLLCDGLADSSESAVSMTPLNRGSVNFSTSSCVTVQYDKVRKFFPETRLLWRVAKE